MGEARRRKQFVPFYRNNVPQAKKSQVVSPAGAPTRLGINTVPYHVEARKDIKIGQKTISFVIPAYDSVAEKMIIEYIAYFQQDGYQITATLQRGMQEIIKLAPQCVVLMRLGFGTPFPQELGLNNALAIIHRLRQFGVRVVYYLDDLICYANNNAPLHIASQCDAVIVATSELKDFLAKITNFTVPVLQVPTHVDIPTFDGVPPLDFIKNITRFKVLMTSSGRVGATGLFEICEKANNMPEFQDVQFIINAGGVAQMRTLINSFRHLHKLYLDNIPLHEYYGLYKSVNVVINPAAETDLDYFLPQDQQKQWLDSKSALKYTLAGAARIPIISSPMRSYTEAIKDGETGYIVKSADEFIEKILYLKSNPAIAAKMGIAARQDVMANYDIRKRYPEYRDAIIGATQVIQTAPPQDRIEIVSSNNKLYIPPIEGGPRSFYENMKQWLPIVSKKEWEVTTILKEATAAIAIAFIYADEIIAEKKVRPELKIIYRLDGLPMDFEGNLEPTNLSKMQEMFRHADFIVWQSLHCQKMWRDANIMLPEINPEGPIIPNGVDLEIFTSQGNQYNFPSFRKYNFLNLNWSAFKHKRIDLLKDIIKSYESSPDVKFYLIGNYINTSQIANINFWKECSNVLYLGQMRNQSIEAKKLLASIYRASRAIIFTSEMEGSPHFALEAAACGCPIIYNSNADIIPELFPTGSLPIEQFDKIFDDSIREMLHANILQEIQNYSIEKCVTKYLEVLSCNKLS